MIYKEKDLDKLLDTMGPYLPIMGFEPEEWLAHPLNVALTDGEGNYSLYERQGNGRVAGHYFMKARGKEALRVAKEMLHEIFTGPYDVRVIQGWTPIEHKGALWMNKQLGFTDCGTIDTKAGTMHFVILTKKEYEEGRQ